MVSVGHYGAPDRMSFTAMGDGVNLAARLEAMNKHYGTEILVSAAVEQAARERFRFRRLDRVAVKGKREGVEIFELLGARVAGEARDGAAELYERALDAYFARRFDEALDLLRSADGDPPSRVLAERCRRYAAEPPTTDWNGIFVATEK
jgi:adenylate cyclase